MPAAQEEIESQGSHCFFTMASSNQWTRASAAEAQASSSSRRRPEFPYSQYDDEKRHSSPPGGYATRKREEIPPEDQRNPRTVPKEDHMAFCAGCRNESAWFQARERLRKKRARTNRCILGGQTICQVLIGFKWPWILSPGSAIGAPCRQLEVFDPVTTRQHRRRCETVEKMSSHPACLSP